MTRAKHIKKLNRAFDRLMRSKEHTAGEATGSVESVRGQFNVSESTPTPDAGPILRPVGGTKGAAVQRMETVLKESRKSVKKGGLNKYSSSVRNQRMGRC